MEMFELRYFLAVAKLENVNRAAVEVHVSAGSLSKAIARLEDELQVPLFFKVGRGIKLTAEGMLLKLKAAHILHLEEDARFALSGKNTGSVNIALTSEEVLQTSLGVGIARKIAAQLPSARVRFLASPESQSLEQVLEGEAHLALVTIDPPSELATKVVARVEFQTCAARSHPLVKKYGARAIPVEEVLKHPFVVPATPILGKIAKSSSSDGWRDDKFARNIRYKVSGLKLLENLIQEDLALGYLPDYFVKASGLVPLKVSGCPYSCQQTVRLVAKDPHALSWLSRLWNVL